MLVIVGFRVAAAAEEGQVITVPVSLTAQFIYEGTEVLVIHAVFVEDTQVVGAAGLECFSGGVRIIAHITGCLADIRGSFLAVTG